MFKKQIACQSFPKIEEYSEFNLVLMHRPCRGLQSLQNTSEHIVFTGLISFHLRFSEYLKRSDTMPFRHGRIEKAFASGRLDMESGFGTGRVE